MADPRRDAIRRVKIFATLSDADCDALLHVIKARKGGAGQVLFRQGDEGASLMIISEGTLSARLRTDDGSEVEIARFGRGEVVGEMAVVDPAPRSATIVASETTVVLELSREGLDSLRRSAPFAASAVVRAILRDVSRRLREVNTRIEQQIDGMQARRDAAGQGELLAVLGSVRGAG